ncbi:hypothetical protein PTKIN_Ptkin08bG0047200 [Pterospermum kingtungense]
MSDRGNPKPKASSSSSLISDGGNPKLVTDPQTEYIYDGEARMVDVDILVGMIRIYKFSDENITGIEAEIHDKQNSRLKIEVANLSEENRKLKEVVKGDKHVKQTYKLLLLSS